MTGPILDNFRASLLMVASMAFFAVEDALIKRASVHLPVGQILMMLGAGGFVLLAIYAAQRGQTVFSAGFFARPVLLRNLAELIGTAGFVTALALNPITTASVILQASPLVVTMGAALFLGEAVGWRRWSAVLVGLAGVVLILRPGMEGFRAEALWAVIGVLGLSMRDVVTRRVPSGVTTLQLTAWAFLSVVFAGMLTLGFGPPLGVPPIRTGIELFAAMSLGLVGYAILTIAVRGGDLSVVAPFRYSRLLFAIVIGFLIFDERPDWPMWVGASLIVGSGLYTLMRESRLRRRVTSP